MSVVSHTPGDAFVATHGPVTSELLVRMATLLNDFNPAHYDHGFAVSVGLPGVIGPGTLLQAWMLADIEARWAGHRRFGGEPVVGELDLRFKEPFLVGDVVEMTYTRDGQAIRIDIAAHRGDDTRRVATATAQLVHLAPPGGPLMVIDTSPGAGLEALVADLAGAIGASPRDVLGVPMAIALRCEVGDDRVFLSGVPVDLLTLVAAAFSARVGDGSRLAIVERRWLARDAVHVGTGPVAAPADGSGDDPCRHVDVGPRGAGPATRLDEAAALRSALRSGSRRLAADLVTPPDFKQIAQVGETSGRAVAAVVADVAASRDYVGRYLLDAGDYFDDERIDQLGDGYVRVASLWSSFGTMLDADIGAAILAIEHDCAGWMRGAAEPPTRYAF